MFCVYSEVMAQDDTVTFDHHHASFSAFTYQFLLRIHEVPPLQYPKSQMIIYIYNQQFAISTCSVAQWLVDSTTEWIGEVRISHTPFFLQYTMYISFISSNI